jgi:hypothetical protein
MFTISWLCVTSWLAQGTVNFFLNKIELPKNAGKVTFAFLLLIIAFISIATTLAVQSGLSTALDNIIVLQGVK